MRKLVHLLHKKQIEENLQIIQKKIQQGCSVSHRSSESIILVGVTKRHDFEVIQAFLETGYRHIGESYVLKGLKKGVQLGSLSEQLDWHFIGHLQKNKIKKALSLYSFFHSIDSPELVVAMEKEAKKLQKSCSILLQINISGEVSKFGFTEQGILNFFEKFPSLEHVQIKGLMTIAPFVEPDKTRAVFRKLRNLRDQLQKKFPMITHLSMGMSNDYEIALEEGATIIRLGSVLFEGIPESKEG